MYCPACGSATVTIEGREHPEGLWYARRRRCANPLCEERFATREIVQEWEEPRCSSQLELRLVA